MLGLEFFKCPLIYVSSIPGLVTVMSRNHSGCGNCLASRKVVYSGKLLAVKKILTLPSRIFHSVMGWDVMGSFGDGSRAEFFNTPKFISTDFSVR